MQALRDAMGQLQGKAVVFGISADTVESHKKFAQQFHLNYPLLADPDKKVIDSYGILNPAGYANRVSFIIGPDGKIENVDRTVSAEFSKQGETLTSRHGTDLALLLSNWKAKVGGPVPNFSLPNYDGTPVPLIQPKTKATVVLFISKNCPVSTAYDDRIAQISTNPAYKEIAFLGINSNSNETAEEVKADAEKHHFSFPVAKDWNNLMADHFGITHTPEVWIVDSKGAALYHGAIDDSQNPDRVKNHYLQDALDAALAGKPAPTAETRAFGCAIRRVRSSHQKS